jgi:hypothetical protein
MAGASGLNRWQVVECTCGLCTQRDSHHVAVNEKSLYENDDGSPIGWRHVHFGNLERCRS